MPGGKGGPTTPPQHNTASFLFSQAKEREAGSAVGPGLPYHCGGATATGGAVSMCTLGGAKFNASADARVARGSSISIWKTTAAGVLQREVVPKNISWVLPAWGGGWCL